MEFDVTTAVSFDNKVAGHDGVLQDASGSVVIKPASEHEIEFYQSLALHPSFASIAPRFYGVLELSESAGASALERAVVLENVTAGFRRPSVIDVKLGRQLWDERASLEKRLRLDDVAAKTTSGSLAMRIAGMKVWDHAAQDYMVYDKNYGRTFDKDNVDNGIADYLKGASPETYATVTELLLAGIDKIAKVIENEESRMYSASILAVYESEVSNQDDDHEEEEEEEEEDDEEEEEKHPLCRVKLIDFAHATWTPGEGKDENALEGIYNLRAIFGRLNATH